VDSLSLSAGGDFNFSLAACYSRDPPRPRLPYKEAITMKGEIGGSPRVIFTRDKGRPRGLIDNRNFTGLAPAGSPLASPSSTFLASREIRLEPRDRLARIGFWTARARFPHPAGRVARNGAGEI
jgi:hypothetical protein